MSLRNDLGDFSSIVCFKAVITGVEDTLGPDGAAVVFTRAGRVRGHNLARELGLSNTNPDIDHVAEALNKAIGKDGTRLCKVDKAYKRGEDIVIETSETVCSAGEDDGSDRLCTFTLGAVQGALEEATGQMFIGKQTESVLRGSTVDKFVFSPM